MSYMLSRGRAVYDPSIGRHRITRYARPRLVRLGPRRNRAAPARKRTTALVKQVISKLAEDKMIGWQLEDNVTHNSPIGAADCVPVVQQIAPGVSAQQRSGDRVKPKSLTVRGIVSFTPDTCTTTQNVYVRLLILAQKNIKVGNDVAAGSVDSAHLLRPGYVGGDQVSFDGTTKALNAPINTDLFRVYMDKTVKLTASLVAAGGREAMPQYSARYSYTFKELPANLTWDDGNGNWANNFAPFFCMGYAFPDGTADPVITQRLINNCSAFLKYEDM